MGRTGIRGKGVLWRWGPNHVIKAVITRWRKKYTADLLPTSSYLYVEGKRVLEFITVPKNEFSEGLSEVNYGLPGVRNSNELPFNPYLTNGFSHHYQLDESTFIFRGVRNDF